MNKNNLEKSTKLTQEHGAPPSLCKRLLCADFLNSIYKILNCFDSFKDQFPWNIFPHTGCVIFFSWVAAIVFVPNFIKPVYGFSASGIYQNSSEFVVSDFVKGHFLEKDDICEISSSRELVSDMVEAGQKFLAGIGNIFSLRIFTLKQSFEKETDNTSSEPDKNKNDGNLIIAEAIEKVVSILHKILIALAVLIAMFGFFIGVHSAKR